MKLNLNKIIPLLFVTLMAGCDRQPSLERLGGQTQGSSWSLSYWSRDKVDRDALLQALEAELARIDRNLSNYRDDSRIARFNANPSTEPRVVGAEIFNLVQRAERVSRASHGCYDLSIWPLYQLWGFGGESFRVPSPGEIDALLARTGMDQLELLPPDSLRKTQPRLSLDLSSIGQGYTVGRLAEVVEAAGIDHYLVEVGGELQTRGQKPDGSHWRIGIERPLPGGRQVHKALEMRRQSPMAVMTSGTYRHYFDEQGRRYSHVLDARTGRPVSHDTVSVTVLDEDPTRADAWSTALLCLGRRAGLEVADDNGLAALFISLENEALRETSSHAWSQMEDVDVR